MLSKTAFFFACALLYAASVQSTGAPRYDETDAAYTTRDVQKPKNSIPSYADDLARDMAKARIVTDLLNKGDTQERQADAARDFVSSAVGTVWDLSRRAKEAAESATSEALLANGKEPKAAKKHAEAAKGHADTIADISKKAAESSASIKENIVLAKSAEKRINQLVKEMSTKKMADRDEHELKEQEKRIKKATAYLQTVEDAIAPAFDTINATADEAAQAVSSIQQQLQQQAQQTSMQQPKPDTVAADWKDKIRGQIARPNRKKRWKRGFVPPSRRRSAPRKNRDST